MMNKRMLARILVAAVLSLHTLGALGWANERVSSVAAVGMTVSDLDRSVDFYTTILGFEKISETEVWGSEVEHLQGVFGARLRTARMRLGEEEIQLTEYLTPKGRPFPGDTRSNDLWFQHIAIIVRDMDAAYRHLRSHRVQHASTAPQRLPDWNPAAGGIEAFYFRDPDGHFLEILSFPPGKGDPKWHRATGALFLGIDHTAIVVGDTERSLAFYRDLLGLRVAGESMNYGTEQEHLNNVFGAMLRITALRAPEGPGIEFLEYIAPSDGRPYPLEARPNDLLHWQTVLVTSGIDALGERLRAAKSRFVSSGVVEAAGAEAGYRKSLLVRDPDGHVMQLVER